MANVTDPLIKSVQGSDPQNLMEYITRQKIYDSRFWKEECFGLTAADVMERAASSLTCVGGTFSGMGKPTRFLSLVLKLLQLQPELSVVRTFLEQDHFKYLRVLGAFYLRLTGRPQDIYEMLDPLYADYSKLKYRDVNEWKLMHVDEFADELLTKPICCGIAMPRLPRRETLQEAGYLEEGPRQTALHDALTEAGGIKEYLEIRVDQELRRQLGKPTSDTTPTSDKSGSYHACDSAVSLWERRYGKLKTSKRKDESSDSHQNTETEADATKIGGGKEQRETGLDTVASSNDTTNPLADEPHSTSTNDTEERNGKRKADAGERTVSLEKKKKKKKKEKYGTLFKPSATKSGGKRSKDDGRDGEESKNNKPPDQNSDEYWNDLRSSLGMKALKK
eukprot:CAMPEP_0201225916 /NCGR_PEP_ID=MMETSP0851-20130426/194359_1 /ASSEMBLY_ACC=CAM_ASM_000631 /TAXON_ID=183588 /ORGANISM="Pseudo-nitzschia fraudulenta, Strain WWA7" /LENGTH=391 /DNA_ID=CAMNT_0047515693 /DNA_START=7 /DNA_END=1182 /DNA_ORIENTATION=+